MTNVRLADNTIIANFEGKAWLCVYKRHNRPADTMFIKLPANGALQWNQTYCREWSNTYHSAIATADGGYFLVCNIQPAPAERDDLWLIKIDATGFAEWNQTYGGTDNEFGSFVLPTSNAGLLLVGGTAANGQGDILLVKLGPSSDDATAEDTIGFSLLLVLVDVVPFLLRRLIRRDSTKGIRMDTCPF
ncbi:MAG: hypothetical protein ACFFGZ_02465 [Candidatus Thorarchaeota archaeon]